MNDVKLNIKLDPPNLERGPSLMKTLSLKCSAREFSSEELSLEDLSDLLWAADGINRPEENKSTASSALNAHDVDIFVFMKNAIYLYDPGEHSLQFVLDGDYRAYTMGHQNFQPKPPIQIVLVSDVSRFPRGPQDLRCEWGAIDAGIVSQNISLFCAAAGLHTVPRASMVRDEIREVLGLNDTQYIFLNHPIGYPPVE